MFFKLLHQYLLIACWQAYFDLYQSKLQQHSNYDFFLNSCQVTNIANVVNELPENITKFVNQLWENIMKFINQLRENIMNCQLVVEKNQKIVQKETSKQKNKILNFISILQEQTKNQPIFHRIRLENSPISFEKESIIHQSVMGKKNYKIHQSVIYTNKRSNRPVCCMCV